MSKDRHELNGFDSWRVSKRHNWDTVGRGIQQKVREITVALLSIVFKGIDFRTSIYITLN